MRDEWGIDYDKIRGQNLYLATLRERKAYLREQKPVRDGFLTEWLTVVTSPILLIGLSVLLVGGLLPSCAA